MAERPCFMLPLFCVCQAAVRYIIALAPWEERRRKAMSDQMIEKDYAVEEIRKECRQFAMLYFHFVKTMVKRFGKEEARELVRESVFSLAMERSSILKEWSLPWIHLGNCPTYRLWHGTPALGPTIVLTGNSGRPIIKSIPGLKSLPCITVILLIPPTVRYLRETRLTELRKT